MRCRQDTGSHLYLVRTMRSRRVRSYQLTLIAHNYSVIVPSRALKYFRNYSPMKYLKVLGFSSCTIGTGIDDTDPDALMDKIRSELTSSEL